MHCGTKYANNSSIGTGGNSRSTLTTTSSQSSQKSQKNNSGLKIIIAILVIYLGLATLDALGVFVIGTYNEYKDGELVDGGAPIIVEFYGKLGGKDGEYGMSYRVNGEDINIYWGDSKLMNGEVVNGVMRLSLMGETNYYCKDGKEPNDFNEKGFMDYFRTILSPASKLISNIIYGLKDTEIGNDEAEDNTENNTGNNDNITGSNASHICNYSSKGICTICNESIEMNLALPSTPITIKNIYAGNDHTYIITSLSCEISNYNAGSNTISYKITVKGENAGNSGSFACRIRWKITDNDGTVIETDGQYSPSVGKGEVFASTFTISGLDADKEYILEFIRDTY